MSDDARADEIKALCRDYAEDMIMVLVEIARDETAKEAPRVKAAETILNHGVGSPSRKIEKTVDVTLHDHGAAQLAAFRKLADKRAKTQLQIPHYEEAEFEEVKKEKKS
jgi:hypothetical protein